MESSGRLKYERMQRGWSQARVAELVGTDAGNVSRWERGHSSPSPYFRERLCQLYGKNAQELGLLEEEPKAQGERAEAMLWSDQSDQGTQASPLAAGLSPDAAKSRQTEVTGSSRFFACLSYVLGWLTGLLVLLFHRSNRFVLFHSLQSVCFFGGIHLVVLLCTVAAPFTASNAVLTLLRDVCGPLAVLLGLIAWAVGMVQAARGNEYQLPLVGGWCHRLALVLARVPAQAPARHQG